MTWAERAYEYKMNGKKKQENEEEVASRLIQRRNKLFEKINKLENPKDFLNWSKELKELEVDGYTDKYDLIMLRKQVKDKMQQIKETNETRFKELNEKQDSIKSETFPESVEILKKIYTEADNILLGLLMQLSRDEVRNKLIISNMMKKEDRATAIALMKLSEMPLYRGMITPRMKEKLLKVSKSKAENEWLKKQNSKLEQSGKEMANIVIKNIMLKKMETGMF